MTVTTINEVTNQNSALYIDVVDRENQAEDALDIAPGVSRGVNISIPWCTSNSDFSAGRYLEISGGEFGQWRTLFVIWQYENQVSYNTQATFLSWGQCIPTDCAVGGNRKLTIGGNASAPTITLTPN